MWNAARYTNRAFDRMVADFTAAPSIADQRRHARRIQQHLLQETPVIYSYFYNFIAATGKNVRGYVPDAMGWINLRKVTIS